MTDQAEAQAALDAVRREVAALPGPEHYDSSYEKAILAALENLDARLKALEGK